MRELLLLTAAAMLCGVLLTISLELSSLQEWCTVACVRQHGTYHVGELTPEGVCTCTDLLDTP